MSRSTVAATDRATSGPVRAYREQIGEDGNRALIAIHVPLALLIMALAAYLSVTAAQRSNDHLASA